MGKKENVQEQNVPVLLTSTVLQVCRLIFRMSQEGAWRIDDESVDLKVWSAAGGEVTALALGKEPIIIGEPNKP